MARILHVVGDSKYGGGFAVITALAVEAKRHGHDVAVLSTDATAQEQMKLAGVPTVDLDCIWRPVRPLRDLLGLLRLRRYLLREHYDLIHTHTSKAGFVGRLAARWARVPVIVHTVHGFAFHEASPLPLVLTYTLLERIAALFCDALVTVSQYHCDWAARLRIGNCQTRLAIPNGVAADRVKAVRGRSATRGDLGVCDDEILCLTAGRLAKQKGIEVLLRGLVRMPAKTKLRCVLAGDGEERQAIEQMVEDLGLRQRVVLLGFRTDLGNLHSAADIVVLPSVREGLSIALLEAMAAGRAIVATDIGSNLEVLKGGELARIVPAGNAEALAVAITELAEDRLLREHMGRKALEEFQRSYCEDTMLARYMSLYERLLQEKCR